MRGGPRHAAWRILRSGRSTPLREVDRVAAAYQLDDRDRGLLRRLQRLRPLQRVVGLGDRRVQPLGVAEVGLADGRDEGGRGRLSIPRRTSSGQAVWSVSWLGSSW